MSYPISQNIKPNQPAMGFNTPPLSEVDAEKIKQNVNDTIQNQNNIVTQAANQEEKDQITKVALTIPIWLGISKLMEKFNKACADRKDGKKNLLEHVRDFGDGIGEKFESNENFKKIAKVSEKVKSGTKTFIQKVPVLDAFFNNPAKPKNTMAAMMKGGTLYEEAQDTKELIEGFIKNLDKSYNETNLNALGITAQEFEKIEKAPHENVKRLIEICKDRAKVCKDKNLDDFIQLANVNTGSAPWAKNFFKKIIGRKAYTFLMGREVRWSESANKLEALKGLKGNYGKTFLGKILPKYFIRITEGLTNGTAGGKLAIAMQAACFADAIIRTAKAKKGDKGKTFIESCVNDLSYYLLMPVGLGILYGLGGLKYIGMNTKQVEAYRNKLEKFNKDVDAGLLTNKGFYKERKLELKNMLKGDTKLAKTDGFGKTVLKSITNVIHKPLKAAGRILSVGLESTKPYLSPKTGILSQIGNAAKKAKSLVNVRLGIGRVPIYLMLIAPPLVNLVVKGCHAIFGKPEKSLLDDGKESKKAEQPKIVYPTYPQQQGSIQPSSVIQPAQSAQPQTAPQQEPVQPASVMQPAQQNKNLAYNSDTPNQRMITVAPKTAERYIPSDEGVKVLPEENLINMYNSKDSNRRTMIPTEEEPVRRYIPADDGVKPATPDSSKDEKINTLLNRADRAEKSATKYIR